jgi:murein DD-endopeptidase MepM/ murein hydrolase activator NlpD
MKRFVILWVTLASLWRLEIAACARDPGEIIWPQAADVGQGDVVELKVVGTDLTRVEGRMGEETIYFFPAGTGSFMALVGADLEAKPGPVKVALEARTRAGSVKNKDVMLRIKSKPFPEESFTVPPEFDQLSKAVLDRIRGERKQFTRAFSTSSPQRLWQGAFIEPLAGKISSPFGLRRIINGAPRSPHTGADLKALMGTPVLAANRGRVVLRGDFFYSGKSLVLDHGGGLFTMYFHLSEFRADDQVLVRKGDVIGLSGMSGRVTGPHLHWGARINDARIDPFQLIAKISAPGTVTREANSIAGKTGR